MLKTISYVFNNSYTVTFTPASHKRYFPGDQCGIARTLSGHRRLFPTRPRGSHRGDILCRSMTRPYTPTPMSGLTFPADCPDVRTEWIKQRGDTEILSRSTSGVCAPARTRSADVPPALSLSLYLSAARVAAKT